MAALPEQRAQVVVILRHTELCWCNDDAWSLQRFGGACQCDDAIDGFELHYFSGMQYNEGFCCIFELCASERVEFATIPSTREPVGAFCSSAVKSDASARELHAADGGGRPVI